MYCIPWRKPGQKFNQVTHYAAWLNGCWQFTRYGQQTPYNWLQLSSGVRDSRLNKALLHLIRDCVTRRIGKVLLLFLSWFIDERPGTDSKPVSLTARHRELLIKVLTHH